MENKWYMSSAGPKALSLPIRGALMLYVPATLELLQELNIPLTETKLVGWVTVASLVIALLVVAVGLLRKVVLWVKNNVKI